MQALVVFATFVLLTAPARADEPKQHRGFYLRMSLGPSATGMRAEDSDVRIRGGGGSLSVAVGGALTENLVLYGELFRDGIDDPDVDGTHVDSSRAVEAGLGGIGPGVSYYFMPLNLYVSGTVALMWGTLTIEDELDPDDRTQLSTKGGLGLSLMVGKEWWLSRNWGLGIAARLTAAGMKDDDIVDGDAKWSAGGFALLLSATYN